MPIDERDVTFVLYEHLRIQELARQPRPDDFSREAGDVITAGSRRFADSVLGPLAARGDREGCAFDRERGTVTMPAGFREAWRAYAAGGWMFIEADGQIAGLPRPLIASVHERHNAACTAFMTIAALTGGAARLMASFASPELRRVYLEPLARGECTGTMCLTEPQAGSAVGDLTTSAVPDGDGYLLDGTKIFISAGQHDLSDNIVHLVLARLRGAPAGISGLSLFLVPRVLPGGQPNDVRCLRLEEKMGLHASPTCTLRFGEGGRCRGFLVGEAGGGMRAMFKMMNETRLLVGIQAAAVAAAAHTHALAYARERLQGPDAAQARDPKADRIPIARHPDVARMLLWTKARTEAMRALIYFIALQEDLARSEDGAEAERAAALVNLLTPVCKAYCSQEAVRVADTAMLVLGGAGFTREHPIERHSRDLHGAPIYEGTNGIQAIDLVARKIGARGGAALLDLARRVGASVAAHPDDPAVQPLGPACEAMTRATLRFAEHAARGDVHYPLLHASPFLTFLGHLVCGWLLGEQAAIARGALERLGLGGLTGAERRARLEADPEARFYDGKRRAAEAFVAEVVPEIAAGVAAIERGARGPLEVVF